MNKKETLALFEEAQAAEEPAVVWNAWANEKLAERRAMEEAGTWEAGKEDWERSAAANFSGHQFKAWANFEKFFFPADASFRYATFEGGAVCTKAVFKGKVDFQATEFGSVSWFDGATFEGRALFVQAIFKYYVTFTGAGFRQEADFRALCADRGFSLGRTSFVLVPSFIEAHFTEAPRLDQISLRPGAKPDAADQDLAARYRALKRLAIQAHDHDREHEFFAGELRSMRGTQDKAFPNLPALFQREFDEQGRPRPVWPGGARFWLGVFYEALSDFGRSFVRPLLWLVLSFVLFSGVYLSSHFAAHKMETGEPYERSTTYWFLKHHLGLYPFDQRSPPRCVAGEGDPLSAAWQLSLRKSLLFVGWVQAQKINQLNACLFGVQRGYPSRDPDGSYVPRVPDGVFTWSLVQTLISTVLIFLMLLALRNYFRIK